MVLLLAQPTISAISSLITGSSGSTDYDFGGESPESGLSDLCFARKDAFLPISFLLRRESVDMF